MKVVGKCAYCGDSIYDFQEIIEENKKKYHKGCYEILQREEGNR